MATGEFPLIAKCRGNDGSGSMPSTLPGTGTGKYYDQKINWTTTPNPALLTTTVKLDYYVRCNNSIAYTQCYFIPKVLGKQLAAKNININYTGYTNNWKLMGSNTVNVKHNATTGEASILLTASFTQTQLATYPWALRDGSISYNLTLPTISVTANPMAKAKHAGVWKKATAMYARSGGVWKEMSVQGKNSGAWKSPVD